MLIVASVLLAFGLNEWRAQRADRALAASVLMSFTQEIQANLELLEAFQPLHVRLAEAIGTLDPASVAGRSAMEVVTTIRDDGGTVLMAPAEAAWQTAVSTGALRLLDYETAAVLSRIYTSQRDYVGQTAQRLTDVVFSSSMFDGAATVQSLHILMALLNELAAQEASLMGEYRNALTRLHSLTATSVEPSAEPSGPGEARLQSMPGTGPFAVDHAVTSAFHGAPSTVRP